jgi:hypothetical protein
MKRSLLGTLVAIAVAVAAGGVGFWVGYWTRGPSTHRPRAVTVIVAISRNDAVRVALEDARGSSTALVTLASARVGRFEQFEPGSQGVPSSQPVWALIFKGRFPPASCGGFRFSPGGPVCPPPATSLTEIIDATTGEWLMAGTG